jgi:FG-GAP-like repeat
LVDLDGDGRKDIISGSWPGEIYFFRRRADGTFAAGKILKDRRGKAINVGHASSPFAVDWNGDGTLDLLVGTVAGEVYFIPNEGRGNQLAFGEPRRLGVNGKPIKVAGDAAPVAADWDGDGKLDLLVGAEDGSVIWFRNVGSRRWPRLAPARTLIGKSALGWGNDDSRREKDWGLRVKLCVVDWNGDGRLDIVMGDRCGGFKGKPARTAADKAEEKAAADKLPELRHQWSTAYREYRKGLDAPDGKTPKAKEARARQLDSLREQLRRLKEEIVVVQEIQSHYQPQNQAHGFVWLFLRKPAVGPRKPAPRGR